MVFYSDNEGYIPVREISEHIKSPPRLEQKRFKNPAPPRCGNITTNAALGTVSTAVGVGEHEEGVSDGGVILIAS